MNRVIVLTTALALGSVSPTLAQSGLSNYGGGSGTAAGFGNNYGMSGLGLQPFPLGAPVNTVPQTYQPATGGLGSGYAQYGVNSLPAAPIIPTMTNNRYDLRPDSYQYWRPPTLRDTSGMWKNGATDDQWLNTRTSATTDGANYDLDPLPRSGRMYNKQTDLRFGGSSMEDSAYGRLLRRLDGDHAPGQVYVNGKRVEMPRTEPLDDDAQRRLTQPFPVAPATIHGATQKPVQRPLQGTIGAPQTPE